MTDMAGQKGQLPPISSGTGSQRFAGAHLGIFQTQERRKRFLL